MNKRAIQVLNAYANNHDIHYCCLTSYNSSSKNRSLIKKLCITLVPFRAPFDYDGRVFHFRDLSDEMIIHEVAHHMVTERKDRRRCGMPEFGLGASPTTENVWAAEAMRQMPVEEAKEEELEASILAAYVAQALGMDINEHLRYTNTSFFNVKQQNARKRLIKWKLIDANFVPADYLLTIH